MKATISDSGHGGVLRLSGAADYQAIVDLRQAFDQAIDALDGRVICDISQLNFICSDALGVIICARLKARTRGGYVRFVRPQQRVGEVLETTRLDQIFGVFDTADEARAAEES